MRTVILSVVSLTLMAACVGGNDGLRRLDGGDGPDEFAVQPAQPLAIPDQLSLPAPGGGNRAIVDPTASAILALGGDPGAATAGGIPTRDAALVTAVSRNGVDPDIRATLAREDEAFRQSAALRNWFNWLGRDRYFQAYARQSLDAYAELDRFREAGVTVPTAPPE